MAHHDSQSCRGVQNGLQWRAMLVLTVFRAVEYSVRWASKQAHHSKTDLKKNLNIHMFNLGGSPSPHFFKP